MIEFDDLHESHSGLSITKKVVKYHGHFCGKKIMDEAGCSCADGAKVGANIKECNTDRSFANSSL